MQDIQAEQTHSTLQASKLVSGFELYFRPADYNNDFSTRPHHIHSQIADNAACNSDT